MTYAATNTATPSKTFKKSATAALAIAMVASAAMATATTTAEAGKKKKRFGAFVAGAIVGGAIIAGSRHRHGGGYYHSGHSHGYVEDCWTEKRVYWRHGHRKVRYVEVCS